MTIAPNVASGSAEKNQVKKSATIAVRARRRCPRPGCARPPGRSPQTWTGSSRSGTPGTGLRRVFAAPSPISSWFGSMRYPCAAAKLRAGATASAKATSAIPKAPGSRSPHCSRPIDGHRGGARPAGISPTTATRRALPARTRSRSRCRRRARPTRRDLLERTLQPDQQQQTRHSDDQRREVRLRQMDENVPQALQKLPSPPSIPGASHLLDGDQQGQAGDEARHHRVEKNCAMRAELQQPRRARDHPGQ